MLKIIGLSIIFIIIILLEVPGLINQKRKKDLTVFFLFLIAGYILNLLAILDIHITPVNKVIATLLKPIGKIWGQ
ncbi:MAG: hypothetical protein ACPL3A_02805 [Thermoanaerobacteraceae bacterium]